MHYPFWYVPGLTSPMWIAIIAVLHVYVSMYAVGGSILLALQTQQAYRHRDRDLLEYLRNHTWFFVLITVVYGSLTGVGIWWTIGLTSPLATEDVIHVFVLAWAMEYVTFILEVFAAFIFFYYWGRLAPKDHTKTGWIYAGAAYGSLVIITAITAFQLNNGNWVDGQSMWKALANPQAIPQILARTGGALLLGAMYFFLHSTIRIKRNEQLRNKVGQESARWAVVGSVLTVAGGLLWYALLPPSGHAALVGAAVLNILMFAIFALTAATAIMMYFGPLKNPAWLTPGFAILFFGVGLAATGTGEFIREGVRKPYIVYNRVLGSQIRPQEVKTLQEVGYLAGGTWTSAYILDKYPELNGNVDPNKMLGLPLDKRRDIGRTIFMYHCNDCHAVEGYSAVAQLSRGWNRRMVKDLVVNLDRYHYFMPPWSGTDAEAELLTDFLTSVNHPYPDGLAHGPEEVE